ncbi:hypothetical protein EKO23_18170 [Nocardioides guangzhouensis]|uniref:Uncharacterized protein n=1 Tax=Nocardioides guangzhouensis TaxID=2497878 RepID=A0A4Q4Z7D5_9ACTN|nr:hypothetical protein [Nocardioides guangzhouensis]RYP83683.1 hypothetical protein EKO23_18170 [Nocardioides guangzhouensis]
MSSIEERLARDIAAVTRGVVVTEQDLRNASNAVDERLDTQRRLGRRRTLAAVAAAAVVLPIVGVGVYRTLGDDRSAPPAGPAPAPSPSVDVNADFLAGDAPTPDLLQGVWRVDDGVVHLRFSAPDYVASDDRGRLFDDPAVEGRYEIEGDLVTVHVSGGRAGCAGQTFAMRASLPEPGFAHVVHTQPGTGSCSQMRDARWVLEQVAPSKGLEDLGFSAEPGWGPATGLPGSLYGVWVAERGGHVLEIDPDGSYSVIDESGEPVDRGQWSLRGRGLTLTSSADSSACSAGDRLVWSGLEQVDPGTTGMRGTVAENTCAAAWADKTWVLVPHEGS